jgi:hypothetical protein
MSACRAGRRPARRPATTVANFFKAIDTVTALARIRCGRPQTPPRSVRPLPPRRPPAAATHASRWRASCAASLRATTSVSRLFRLSSTTQTVAVAWSNAAWGWLRPLPFGDRAPLPVFGRCSELRLNSSPPARRIYRPRWCHGSARRSATPIASISTTPTTARIVMAANTRVVSNMPCALRIT